MGLHRLYACLTQHIKGWARGDQESLAGLTREKGQWVQAFAFGTLYDQLPAVAEEGEGEVALGLGMDQQGCEGLQEAAARREIKGKGGGIRILPAARAEHDGPADISRGVDPVPVPELGVKAIKVASQRGHVLELVAGPEVLEDLHQVEHDGDVGRGWPEGAGDRLALQVDGLAAAAIRGDQQVGLPEGLGQELELVQIGDPVAREEHLKILGHLAVVGLHEVKHGRIVAGGRLILPDAVQARQKLVRMGALFGEVGEFEADGTEGAQMGRNIRQDLPAAARVRHQEEHGDGIVGSREGGGDHLIPLPLEPKFHHAPIRGGHGAGQEDNDEAPVRMGDPGIEGLAREAHGHPVLIPEHRNLEEGEAALLAVGAAPHDLGAQGNGPLLEGLAQVLRGR